MLSSWVGGIIEYTQIESDEIDAQISVDGTVTFIDAMPHITKTRVDKALAEAQIQSKALAELERAINVSREYLQKVRVHSVILKV